METRWSLLSNRYLNKGTAFNAAERDRYGLEGLLPPVVETIETQLRRVRLAYNIQDNDLDRHRFLRGLQERNSVLYYRFLADNLAEVLPVIYTPTVGVACEAWSENYRSEHGLYVSWEHRHRIPELLDNAIGDNKLEVVVVTDGERVLGLGDLGVGGMGISIGKLSLYTSAGGINPGRSLPVLLDAGTNNQKLLSDPLYIGWRHERIRGAQYDELVDAFVSALHERHPDVLMQWEDFAQLNATRLLVRHRKHICSFNDDVQGTAIVASAAIAAGLRMSGTPFADLRLVIAGAGSAGIGIAGQVVRALMTAGLSETQAIDRCWMVDRDGLLHDEQEDLREFQRRFERPRSQVTELAGSGTMSLLETVKHVQPHAIVGVTGQAGLFSEEVIREQAAAIERPVVLPLSNPTLRAEATPGDVIEWSDGRAIIGTGSPFGPVKYRGVTHHISQVNNVYVFPGIGLGAVAVKARAISDDMLTTAANALGELAPESAGQLGAALLPPVSEARDVARHVATAVACQAVAEGLADPLDDSEVAERVDKKMWQPEYRERIF
ncbi:MAG: NAD-dependent malic enzyme [Acidimicrobiales bacterium]